MSVITLFIMLVELGFLPEYLNIEHGSYNFFCIFLFPLKPRILLCFKFAIFNASSPRIFYPILKMTLSSIIMYLHHVLYLALYTILLKLTILILGCIIDMSHMAFFIHTYFSKIII